MVEPAVSLQVLEADVADPSEVGDGDILEFVSRAVRAFAGSRPLVEIDGRNRRAVQDDGDLGALGRDRHVVSLAGGILGVHVGRDQAVEGPGIAEPVAGRVVESDFDARVDRVCEIADAEKDAGVAAFFQLVIEIELEIGELLVVDDEVASRAVRVQAIFLDVGTVEVVSCPC